MREFEDSGYKVVLTRIDHNGAAPYRFAYMEGSDGIIIELMDNAFHYVFEDYLDYDETKKRGCADGARS